MISMSKDSRQFVSENVGPPGMNFDPLSNVLRIYAPTESVRAKLQIIEEQGAKADADLFELQTPWKIKPSSTNIQLDEATKFFLVRLRHETDHLRRHQGTSYGLFYHYLNSGVTLILFRLVNEKVRNGTFAGFPFVSFAEEASLKIIDSKLFHFDDDKPPNSDPAILRLYANYMETMRCLDGTVNRDGALRAFVCLHDYEELSSRWWAKEERLLKAQLLPEEPELTAYYSAEVPDCPQIFGRRFGARHLLEFLAVGREVSMADVVGVPLSSYAELFRVADYSLVLDYLNKYLGDRFLTNTPRASDWPQEIIVSQSAPSLPFELFAAADLALWIPITPKGFHSRTDEIHWTDLHPGWRFLKVSKYFLDNNCKWEPLPYDLEAANQLYRETQNRICDALGWTRVDELCEVWSNHFVSMMQGNYEASGYYISLATIDPRIMSIMTSLALRLKLPYEAAFNFHEDSGSLTTWFPVIMCDGGDLEPRHKSLVWEWLHQGQHNRYTDLFFHRGTRFLAFGPSRETLIQSRHYENVTQVVSEYSAGWEALKDLDVSKRIRQYFQTLGTNRS